MDVRDGLATDKWYRALTYIAALALVGIAALTGDAVLRKALLLIDIGALLVGLGEWINHPFRTAVCLPYKISGYPREARPAGVLMDAVGVLLIGRGIWLLW